MISTPTIYRDIEFVSLMIPVAIAYVPVVRLHKAPHRCHQRSGLLFARRVCLSILPFLVVVVVVVVVVLLLASVLVVRSTDVRSDDDGSSVTPRRLALPRSSILRRSTTMRSTTSVLASPRRFSSVDRRDSDLLGRSGKEHRLSRGIEEQIEEQAVIADRSKANLSS